MAEGTIAQVLAGEAQWHIGTGLAWELSSEITSYTAELCITDPPYSKRVHENVRSSASLPDDTSDAECRTRRRVDLNFEYLKATDRGRLASEMARITRHWNLVFSDTESAWLWRFALEARGMDYIRTGFWDRRCATPAFHGNYPSPAFEAITIARNEPRRWNGGGRRAHYAQRFEGADDGPADAYTFPIVCNRGGERGTRLNEAQKPLRLMLAVLDDYARPFDLVVDFTCGSATTGVAALQRGCRFIGFEKRPEMAETARTRMRAEEEFTTVQARRTGQKALFG